MNKRIAKKLAKKMKVAALVNDANLEIKDLTQTDEFMTGRIAELEEKCTRYVEESMKYKSLYEAKVSMVEMLEADLKAAEDANAKYIERISELKCDIKEQKTMIAELRIMKKQQEEMKNNYFNALNKSIEECNCRTDENDRLTLNYKACADRLDKSEKARRLAESERDCLKQKVCNLETEINKPWWKKVLGWQ